MAKVTRKIIAPTSPFKVQLQKPAAAAVSTLEKLLSADKTLKWDMHKEFSAVIEKVTNSAIKDIDQLNAISPPPVPEPTPPHTTQSLSSFLEPNDMSTPEYSE